MGDKDHRHKKCTSYTSYGEQNLWNFAKSPDLCLDGIDLHQLWAKLLLISWHTADFVKTKKLKVHISELKAIFHVLTKIKGFKGLKIKLKAIKGFKDSPGKPTGSHMF